MAPVRVCICACYSHTPESVKRENIQGSTPSATARKKEVAPEKLAKPHVCTHTCRTKNSAILAVVDALDLIGGFCGIRIAQSRYYSARQEAASCLRESACGPRVLPASAASHPLHSRWSGCGSSCCEKKCQALCLLRPGAPS